MLKMHRIKVFTDRYPWIGPFIWILTIQYFLNQLLVAAAWPAPYSWRFNTISDLGSTVCTTISGRPVCSPLHLLMNASFVVLGIIMATGSLLIYQEFRESIVTLVGFSLMTIAGFGSMLVGLFPENTVPALHLLGAAGPFLLGNISLILLGIALYKISPVMRVYALASGTVSLIALYFFFTGHYGRLGIGGTERLVTYPQSVWLILFGLYISRNHFIYQPLRKLREKITRTPTPKF